MEENIGSTAGASTVPPRQYPVIDTLCMELKNFLRCLEPSPEVTEHFHNARIEVLKGIRQAIDNRIEYLNKSRQHGQKIRVD